MNWRNSIQEIKHPKMLIQKESNWKHTITPEAKDGKDGKNGIDGENGKDGKDGRDGRNGVDGRNGAAWLVSEEAPNQEIGNDGDLCLCENGDLYFKDSGEWFKKLSIKGEKSQTQYIGGGVTAPTVENMIIEAINAIPASGGSSSLVAISTAVDYVITTADFVVVTGSGPVQITMPSTAARRITIKNTSTGLVTVVPASGNINGVSNLQIPGISGALGEANFGTSITLIYAGGQFWIN